MSKNQKDSGLSDLIILGGLGYLLGQGKHADWEPIIQNYKKRLEHLQYLKIPPPMGFLDTNTNIKTIYRESLLGYLFGLSNSVIPSLLRVLEQALIKKYKIVEGKSPSNDPSLKNLIDWAEKIIEKESQIAHSFRLLRNYIHTDILVDEQDAIEAIRHISKVIEKLFPTTIYGITGACNVCIKIQTQTIIPQFSFLGNTIRMVCGCGNAYTRILIP
ncbi:MAG: hypothetical protein IIC67_00800 [Thaumarchaeota archaeon]|nr:hypothetical protein [Nitrososphaerota archaeon]